MIYARAHDQTVAEDYFAAMERVEQRLEISPLEEENYEVVKVLPAAQLLGSLQRLALPQLCQEEQLEIVESLKQALWPNGASEHAPPLACGDHSGRLSES